METARDLWGEALRRGMPRAGCLVTVDVPSQTAIVWRAGAAVKTYPVSTAAKGLGCHQDSYQTPPGWHEVADRIGDGAPLGQVFRARTPTGETMAPAGWAAGDQDLILTRILRLRGLEAGVNRGPGVDSYQRCIYVHGTNQEHRLGDPVSQGCIRMANRDVAELFALCAGAPTWCWIGALG